MFCRALVTCSLSTSLSVAKVQTLPARSSKVRTTAALWASVWCDKVISVGVFLEYCSQRRAIIMPDYPHIQEWDGAIGLLLNCKLNGELNLILNKVYHLRSNNESVLQNL